MLTPTQKRAMRAQSLLNGGMDPREAARECGYKNVNGMMGAIALCLRKLPKEDQEAEMQRMLEAEAQKSPRVPGEAVGADVFTVPGIYEIKGEGEVLVGERIPKTDHKASRKQWAEDVQRRLAERRNEVKAETKHVICKYSKNENTGEMEFKIHICGIDKWLVIDEEIIGGREALVHVLSDMIAGIGCVLEGIA